MAREKFPGKASALWIQTTPHTDYPNLSGEIRSDVAVIGGGIVGLTAAVLLKNSGAKVALLEADRIAGGVSGHTTAKITTAHGLIYRHLIDRFGEEKARQYAAANQGALDFIAEFVREHRIECDFQRTFACSYSTEAGDLEKIHREYEAAAGLGLPVSYAESAPLPFSIRGLVRYENQACFHPRKYLLALAERIPGSGSHLFERARVRNIKPGSPCTVETEQGRIRADRVIVATHFPILNRGMFFAKMVPRRSYVLAYRVEDEAPDGMFYGIAPPYHTFRKHRTSTGEDYLLVGGEDHVTGKIGDTRERYRRLEEFAGRYFHLPAERYHWSTQDNDSVDQVPFVGRHSFLSKRIFVATGFGGWGMTNGTAAALILSDRLSDRPNPWSPIFDPNRTTSWRSKAFVYRNLQVTGTYLYDYLPKKRKKTRADLAPGQAEIVGSGRGKAAAFKDEDGRIHAVSPRCTHMYCKVRWNNAEKSWDCPCHGSRFDLDGKVVHSPATQPLKKK